MGITFADLWSEFMKVAVLGAGFSGMLASYLLEKSGVAVTVYEKQEQIGGHCHTLVSKNDYTELGTTFSFSKEIKALLLTLQVGYTERFVYRNFLDDQLNTVEQLAHDDAAALVGELERLRLILAGYKSSFDVLDYGYIHPDLMVSLSDFLKKHHLLTLCHVLTPLLSSFGFGDACDTQAYYTFKVFDVDTIYTFIRGEKLLFLDKGMSELIRKLSENISDIRYGLEVINVAVEDRGVLVETAYGAHHYDKVLITTKLPNDVIKDELYNRLMTKIDTNPYFTCAYAVNSKNLVTTYYKSHLGKPGKIQFFHATRQNHQTTLVAFAYGKSNVALINGISDDIAGAGIDIKHLITTKQWYIFPHLKPANLSEHFYEDIRKRQADSPIWLIGSLVTHPSITNLYISVKAAVERLLDEQSSEC